MKKLGKFLCFIGAVLSVFLVIALLLQYIDNIYHFIPVYKIVDEKNTTILDLIVKYGSTLVIGILALGASMRFHPILMILIILVIAAVVGFMFYGDIALSYFPQSGNSDGAAIIKALIA